MLLVISTVVSKLNDVVGYRHNRVHCKSGSNKRTEKVRRPKTDVLPLSHAINK